MNTKQIWKAAQRQFKVVVTVILLYKKAEMEATVLQAWLQRTKLTT